jgi:hypothetical protein
MIGAGLLIAVAGGVVILSPKLPWLGHLPGDITIKKENFSFYFPLTTCLLLSAFLSLIIGIFKK